MAVMKRSGIIWWQHNHKWCLHALNISNKSSFSRLLILWSKCWIVTIIRNQSKFHSAVCQTDIFRQVLVLLDTAVDGFSPTVLITISLFIHTKAQRKIMLSFIHRKVSEEQEGPHCVVCNIWWERRQENYFQIQMDLNYLECLSVDLCVVNSSRLD